MLSRRHRPGGSGGDRLACHCAASGSRALPRGGRAGAHGAATGILFVGGTANPYNYNGIGYDGRPAGPDAASWIYDTARDAWIAGPTLEAPTMDHRGLVTAAGAWWTIGGFGAGQSVTARGTRIATDSTAKD